MGRIACLLYASLLLSILVAYPGVLAADTNDSGSFSFTTDEAGLYRVTLNRIVEKKVGRVLVLNVAIARGWAGVRITRFPDI